MVLKTVLTTNDDFVFGIFAGEYLVVAVQSVAHSQDATTEGGFDRKLVSSSAPRCRKLERVTLGIKSEESPSRDNG